MEHTKQTKVTDPKPNYPKVHQTKLFTYLEIEKEKFIICLGNTKVSELTFKTLKAAQDYVHRKPWELIINVMCLTTEKIVELKKHEQK